MAEKERRHLSRCAIGSSVLGKRNAGSVAVSDDSESLSDIDDAEVSRFINTEKEASLKKLIWEAMHNKYMKANGKRMIQPSKVKGSTSAKKTVNLEQEKQNEKKRSSKINYDALAGLLGEPLEDGEAVKGNQGRACSGSDDHEPIQPNDEELNTETEDNEEFETNGYEDEADDEYGAGEEFECW